MLLPKISDLFDLERTNAKTLFLGTDAPYKPLEKISTFIMGTDWVSLGYRRICDGIFVAENAKIAKEAVIIPPAVIGEGTEIRPFSFIRGNVIIGKNCVIGNSTEIKNCIIFDGAQLPHYNYAGDSIIGYMAHLGAGVILSNLRLDKQKIKIKEKNEFVDTGYRKLGALIGDMTEIGCSSVVNPGTVIGRKCVVYPLSRVCGILKEKTVFKGECI